MRPLVARLLLLTVSLWAAPARAETVDLALLLAVDASGSIDADEWALQMAGYEAAFRSTAVHQAIASGGNGAIAVSVVQWSGYAVQARVIDWTVVDGAPAAQALADRLGAVPRLIFGGGTSLSGIIDGARPLFDDNPFVSPRRVLDISGDGANRNSRPAAEARDEAVQAGITINGLPILGSEPELDIWYLENVIGGTGSFMVVAAGFESFGQAILAKLIREIAAAPAPLLGDHLPRHHDVDAHALARQVGGDGLQLVHRDDRLHRLAGDR